MKKKDSYFYKAKKKKLRARSYYKLKEIDEKYNLVKENSNIIDLGCSPGSWLQYLDKKIKSGKIIGVDLLEVKKRNEFTNKVEIYKEDFNKFYEKNENNLKKIKFDLIISDMAPEFSGHKELDFSRTYDLNRNVIEFSEKYLKKNRNLVFKSFQSEELNKIVKELRKKFRIVKFFKPKSSSSKSAETYIICLKKI